MSFSRNIVLLLLSGFLATGCSPGADSRPSDTAPPAAPAEASSKDFGDYVLHFNALTTDQLEPEVAKQYDIVRSKNRALLNISIVKKASGSVGQSVSGSVSASATNLTGQLKNLTLREVKNGSAVYYIGDIAVANGETLIFNIDATPINETSRFSVRFKHQFYAD